MIGNNVNGIKQIENGIKTGEVIGVVMGVFLFGLSVYAFHLSIKVNKLTLKKLNDEGYK